MRQLPKIKIVSTKHGTHIYQDDKEIYLVLSYKLEQKDGGHMPILKVEVAAPIVEVEIEECKTKISEEQ